MARKRNICCCPEEQNESLPNRQRYVSIPAGLGPLFSPEGLSPLFLGPAMTPQGISPDFVKIVNPERYLVNEEYEETNLTKSKPSYPNDPNFPLLERFDVTAMTPVFRGGQNPILQQLNLWSDHGPDLSGTTVYYDWDGTTTFPIWLPDTSTQAEIEAYRVAWFDYVFPDFPAQTHIRGLRQLYELHSPFADVTKPTVREWENWNDKVLNHFRVLSGLPPATPLQELFVMNKWSFERKQTDLWDTLYPGTLDSAFGPCQGGTNIHCGTTFKPALQSEQAPYWNDYYADPKNVPMHPLSTLNQGSEAITVWYNGNAMHAFSRTLRKLFEHVKTTNGVNQIGGHSGTHAFREFYGLAIGRSKWAGSLAQPPAGFTY